MKRVKEFVSDIGGVVAGGGTANAITATSKSPFTSYADGLRLVFKASASNTTAATLNVNSIGAKAIRKFTASGEVALDAGDIQAGAEIEVIYVSTLNSSAGGWQILSTPQQSIATKLDILQPTFTIASASTTDLSTVSTIEGTITGTTTITALGTAAAGTIRSVYFAGILTLTHNATSLILPTGANITTAALDRATFVSLGSGNWRCVYYLPVTSMQKALTLGTQVATTSGTAIDFTGIPASAKRVTIMFSGVSTNGTSLKQVQLGTSGGIQATGYDSLWSFVQAGGAANSAVATTGFALPSNLAADTFKGAIVLTLQNAASGIWTAHGVLQQTVGSVYQMMVSGEKTLSGTLDRIRLTTVNGTDTFDAGAINLLWE